MMLSVIVFLQTQKGSKEQLKRRLFLDLKHKIDADVRTCITV